MRRACRHLPERLWAVLSTGFGPVLGAALLRTSSRRERATMGVRCACSQTQATDGCSMSATDGSGESSSRDGARTAGKSPSPSQRVKGSETAGFADLNCPPGSPYAAVDLLNGIATVIVHEIGAAYALGEEKLGDTLDALLEGVLDTRDVVTEEHAA